MADLRVLIRKRAILKGYYTRFQNRLNNIETDIVNVEELEVLTLRCRDPNFYDGLKVFNKIQNSIEELDSNVEDHDQERDNFESVYFNLHNRVRIILENANLLDDETAKFICLKSKVRSESIAHQLIVPKDNQYQHVDVRSMHQSQPVDVRSMHSQFQTAVSVNDGNNQYHKQDDDVITHNSLVTTYSSNNNNNNAIPKNKELNFSGIKLPPIKLPTFSGEYENWLNFRDSFKSLIHENKQVPTIIKFHRLLSLLSGEALLTIKAIEISEANYFIAWDLLNKRFEQEGLIIDNHIKAILEIESIQKESFSSLQHLTNSLNLNIHALQSLGEPVNQWNAIIIYVIISKVDQFTKREWAKFKGKLRDRPTIIDLQEFLAKRCQLLESLLQTKYKSLNKSSSSSYVAQTAVNKPSCGICNGIHPIFYCRTFLQLAEPQRIIKINELKLCKNCFSKNHLTKNCGSKSVCKKCAKKHNTLLHIPSKAANSSIESSESQINEPQTSTSSTGIALTTLSSRVQILLPSAIVYTVDNCNKQHLCRVLLDSCSQSNYISKTFVKKLHLKCHATNFPIVGINNTASNANEQVELQLKSRFNLFKCTVSCLVLSKITAALPEISFQKHLINMPEGLNLADPNFNQSTEIDALLGAELFWKLLCVGQISLGKNLPILQKTHFGWIISGPIPIPKNNSNFNLTSNCFVCTDAMRNETNEINQQVLDSNLQLSKQVELFWNNEEIKNYDNHKQLTTIDHSQCEAIFNATTSRNDNGRFVVRLPFNASKTQLGESYSIALRRFSYLERKFKRDPVYKQLYVEFIEEYESLNHMSLVNYSQNQLNQAYFLPHHAVIKTDSLTTKLRVVFDASCKTTSGTSLNDTLMVGGVVQSDLFSILLKFRVHKYAFTSDCEKMYRQIVIHPDDRIYQNILWRNNEMDNHKIFQLNTVTYGTASAPFLATRTLKQIAIDVAQSNPKASEIIENNFYVDDLIAAVDDISEGIQIISQINMIFKKYGFSLRKWRTNNPQLMQGITECDTTFLISDVDKNTKVLGLLWNARDDNFNFSTKFDPQCTKVTKRTILSLTSKLFDPLGLVAPIIVKAKLIIQKLWQLNMSWDESVSAETYTYWIQFYKGLSEVNKISIPRFCLIPQAEIIQLHGFADASEKAYGACMYLRSSIGQTHSVNLLCSKTKVAPLKKVTLPKLELCAALLLIRLKKHVLKALNLTINDQVFWSDSTIVLAWIATPSHQLKTFIANRVSEIIEDSSAPQWRHVSSDNNPADLLSRGTNPDNLNKNNLWWHGPSWLQLNASEWPQINCNISHTELPERKVNMINLITIEDTNSGLLDDLILKNSSLTKLQRILVYVLRFVSKCKKKVVTHMISNEEIERAMLILIKHVQKQSFASEIHLLERNAPLPINSHLLSLAPFLHNGILRVGGRIKNARVHFNQRHPILIPNQHHLTNLIINNEHLKTLHGGQQQVLSSIRLKYWPISGLTAVKRVIHTCIICKRFNAKITNPLMGNLPKARITPSKPFSETGVDYAGPFLVKETTRSGRRGPPTKAYLAIFVCFSTKAVHVEVVSSLSTEAFINALKRFIARRGICKTLYSDNGTNFVGAFNDLSGWYQLISTELHNNLVNEFCLKSCINWKFIPARSPHFGGLWEAAVKSVKKHLSKVTYNISLTFEELCTLSTQIEAILNSRPLIPQSCDPNDFQVLTPGHFLVGDSLIALPEPDVQKLELNRLNRFQLMQQVQQQLWKKWSRDYLQLLQTRAKKFRRTTTATIQPGALVILKEATPSLYWRKGRVLETHPGADGVVRVVTIKTSSSVIKRAVNQLIELLPDK